MIALDRRTASATRPIVPESADVIEEAALTSHRIAVHYLSTSSRLRSRTIIPAGMSPARHRIDRMGSERPQFGAGSTYVHHVAGAQTVYH